MTMISQDPIDAFLDAADSVLNSNTFLICIPLGPGGLREQLTEYIASDAFLDMMLSEDIKRGWFNLHTFTDEETPAPKPGKLIKPGFNLNITEIEISVMDFLEAMLRGDQHVGNFFSFYGNQKTRDEARLLAASLIAGTGIGGECRVYALAPDFLQNADNDDQMYYFEGPHGACDTATVLATDTRAYILLTNGAP
jgi:hypothetical protein